MFKRSLAHSVVRAWRLGVAVGAQRDARVVGCLHAHASVTAGMRGLAAAFDPAGAARERPDPGFVRFVARRPLPSLSRGAAHGLTVLARCRSGDLDYATNESL